MKETLTLTAVHEVLDTSIRHFGILVDGDLLTGGDSNTPRIFPTLRGAKIARARLATGGEIVEVVVKAKPIAARYQDMVNG